MKEVNVDNPLIYLIKDNKNIIAIFHISSEVPEIKQCTDCAVVFVDEKAEKRRLIKFSF